MWSPANLQLYPNVKTHVVGPQILKYAISSAKFSKYITTIEKYEIKNSETIIAKRAFESPAAKLKQTKVPYNPTHNTHT